MFMYVCMFMFNVLGTNRGPTDIFMTILCAHARLMRAGGQSCVGEGLWCAVAHQVARVAGWGPREGWGVQLWGRWGTGGSKGQGNLLDAG